MLVLRDSRVISTVGDWFAAAPPKGGADQWVPGRSARELAVAWCGTGVPCVPHELIQALRGHDDLAGVSVERAYPEQKIRIDALAGGPRNADLALEARDDRGVIAVTIEAKADEPFDRTVSAVLDGGA